MASLRYLWKHRATFSIASKKFYWAWGKRIFSFAELVRRNRARVKLTQQGAKIHETAEIGQAIVQGNKKKLIIGAFSSIGKVTLALHCSVKIGECVCINDGVNILTGSHDVMDPLWRSISAAIVIEDYVWIGTNAVILPGVHLGRGCVVGAGAVVSKSVAEGEIVVGNPAKPIRKTRDITFNYNPCEFLAANRAWITG
ncbi:acyltransferase [Hymenobacter arizonensis]|uniref:Putative colanic acid biosynthesis acetyltransferase WcaF n=1 Tax=Hymenobacter arizonensis TaxID=1227077 RepID=A0A1I6BRP8_HYMAR|nr:acyltransferase [Hymenobacter arizonensis]SFQ83600.1 putative colanic acid biosynthesis acetyltransferase WcaF [Hymenobacter arizonensis]